VPTVNPLFDKVLTIPGVAELIKPTIDGLRTTLAALATEPPHWLWWAVSSARPRVSPLSLSTIRYVLAKTHGAMRSNARHTDTS
jgi:hypothetical protein